MPRKGNLRLASYNVENLFSRAKVFNQADAVSGAGILKKVSAFQEMLESSPYDEQALVKAFQDELSDFIDVRVDRVRAEGASPRFFFTDQRGRISLNSAIKGPEDWAGQIEFKRERFSGKSIENIRRVIVDELAADIICLCEIEDRRSLQLLCDQVLKNFYPFNILIDGNDDRGIDVALLSKFPISTVRSNVFLKDSDEKDEKGLQRPLFSRDCLEVEVSLSGDLSLFVLCNHFKSKGGPNNEAVTDLKRIKQSQEVANILTRRYRTGLGDWKNPVIVAGDLNERPDRNGANGENLKGMQTSIDPLLTYPGLHNVVAELAPVDQQWTYEFNGQQQIDYLLVSSNLQKFAKAAGAVYSGRYSDGSNGIKSTLEQASDHAAIWVDFDLGGLIRST